ncbi:MAG: hypothetical protein J4469_02470 [Candidatus Aenigmarchaeota archaeon]|nr:hypothetical protein [Candidatus Aenigmarchaeota archaeon]
MSIALIAYRSGSVVYFDQQRKEFYRADLDVNGQARPAQLEKDYYAIDSMAVFGDFNYFPGVFVDPVDEKIMMLEGSGLVIDHNELLPVLRGTVKTE